MNRRPPYNSSDSDSDEMRPRPRVSRADMRSAQAPSVSSPGRRKSRNEIPVLTDTRSRANANKRVPLVSLESDDSDGDDDEKTLVGLSTQDMGGETAEFSQFKLKVIEGADLGRTITVSPSGILIGRGDACDFQLQDGAASRRHAQIQLRNGALTIQDLNTSNGTKINEIQIEANREEPLRNGDKITVGLTVIQVEDAYAGMGSGNDGETIQFSQKKPSPSSDKNRRRNSRSMVPAASPPPVLGKIDQRRVATSADATVDSDAAAQAAFEQHKRNAGKRAAGTVLGDRLRNMSMRSRILFFGVIFLIFAAVWSKSLITEHMAQKREEERLMAEKAANEINDRFSRIKAEAAGALRDKNPELTLQKIQEATEVLPARASELERLRSTAKKDVEAQKFFKKAKSLHASGNYDEALSALRDVDENSSFADLVPELKKSIERDRLEKLKKEIQALMNDRKIEEARSKISELPGEEQTLFLDLLSEASNMAKQEAKEAALQAAQDAKNRKKAAQNRKINEIKEAVAPFVEKLDKGDMRGAQKALDAVNTRSKPSHVAQKINQLKREMPKLKKEYTSGRELFERRKFEQAADPLFRAYKIWSGMHVGGSFGQKLGTHAVECLEKKGTNALNRKDYVTAGKSFKATLQIDPNSKTALSGMASITRKAEEISMQAYTERLANPARARQLYEQVVSMTPPDAEVHKKAKDRLKTLGY